MSKLKLSIGNLVQVMGQADPSAKYKVCEVFSDSATIDVHGWTINEDILGVPLSHEEFINLGFEQLTSKKKGFKSNSYSYTNGVTFILHFDGERCWTNFFQGVEYEYLHEVQNLFQSITLKELPYAEQEKTQA